MINLLKAPLTAILDLLDVAGVTRHRDAALLVGAAAGAILRAASDSWRAHWCQRLRAIGCDP